MKRWPIFATIVAAVAVLTMLSLGIWQLQRKGEKEMLLARYNTASAKAAVAYPAVPVPGELPLFRRSSVQCIKVTGWSSVSGTNAAGDAGYAHLAACQTSGGEGPGATVAVGWSKRPANPAWQGGIISGIIAPYKPQLIKLVATDKVAGLALLAKPSPETIPNNHLFYAVQWFIFAAAAAIIFTLAARSKTKE